MTRKAEQPPPPPLSVSTLLNLSRRARRAEDALSLQFILVNETYALTEFRLGILWVKGEGVIAQSAVSQVDRNSSFNLWLAEIFSQLSVYKEPIRVEPSMLRPEDVDQWSGALPGQALWLSDHRNPQQPVGLLLCRDEPWLDHEIALLGEWMEIWAHAWQKLHAPSARSELARFWDLAKERIPTRDETLTYLRETKAGAQWVVKHPALIRDGLRDVLRKTQDLFRWAKAQGVSGLREEVRLQAQAIWHDKKRRYTWMFWIVVLFPVRLTVLAPGELVPASPAILRAPMDGVVEEFFVKPNEKVTEGQLLFRLDLTSLSSRLQIAQQETRIASTQYRQSALQSLTDEKSRQVLAAQEGKATERKLEAEYLKELFDKAQIKAPKPGVALFDDPSEWVGKPVVAGEKIMVVATEGKVEIEAWIPIADAIELPQKTPVTLYLNATPLSPVDGTLRYVGHEAIQRPDGTYAYRLRAEVDSKEDRRRVGFKGTARVSGQFVPLVYWVFRRPISWLRQFFGI